MKIITSSSIFGLSLLFVSNNYVVRAGTLRGRNLAPSAPTCQEVESYPKSFFCTKDCGIEYWQCVHGEVVAQPMPEGSHCLHGEFDTTGTCTDRDDRCDEIETLTNEDKLLCTNDCSDTYLACSNGSVVEMPMAQGTRCYRNGIVRTSEGHCVIHEEVITYFELMDACKNYPDLEHCASTADPSTPPYTGVEFNDGAWYFVDKVWFSYISTDSEEYGKGWDVFINIRFGHDHEIGRSRSIIASMDYGATQVYKWNQYDLVDGDVQNAQYNCKTDIPDEPITHFIAQIIKNPVVIFELGQGRFDIPDDDEVHDYTTQVTMSASDIGCDLDGDDADVDVLVESVDAAHEETPAEAEPVYTPTFLFKNVVVYDQDEDSEDDSDDFEDEEEDVEFLGDSDFQPIETIEEIRNLFDGYFNVTLNETVCSDGFEQIYDNRNDVVDPILNRGKLTAGTGEDDNGRGEIIEEGTEELSDQLDPISLKLRKLAEKNGHENFTIPQDTMDDCQEGEVLVYHCCSEDIHFLACTPTNENRNCPLDTILSSRCLERQYTKDIIVEPRFLKGNIPMQLHTAAHLESLDIELEDMLTEESFSEILDPSTRKLFWDKENEDQWVAQDEEDFTSEENFLPNIRGNFNQWISSPISNDTDVTPEDMWDNFGDLFLGRGGGLPNVKELLKDLTDLDETLASFYEFNTALEGDMLSIFDLMNSVDQAQEKLEVMDDTLSKLDRVLKLVSIIKYVKPVVIPIRNAVSKTRLHGIAPGLAKVKKLRDAVTKQYKPKLKRALTKNEQVRGVLAKSRFVNQNLVMNPFHTTRNCKPSDTAAEILGPVVAFANTDASLALEEIQEFRVLLKNLVNDLSGVFNLVDGMVDKLQDMAEVTNPIGKAMDPFYAALSTRITIPIWGPFCHRYANLVIRYPCGIRRCRKCYRIFRRRRCIRYPCGIKKCTFRKRIRLPVFCTKTFSFAVNDVLKGISGVMDIIFYPLNKAVDAILKAIPMPPIPLLPDFPSDFGELDQLSQIGNLLEGPKFPSNLLDFSSVHSALPGIDDMVCGKSSEDLLEILDLVQSGQVTPEVVRDFYDGCGGWQDLNPVCETTEELFCGDGGCPTKAPSTSPTDSHSTSPTESLSIEPSTSPTVSSSSGPSLSPSIGPSSNPSSNPIVSASIGPSIGPSSSPIVSASAGPSFGPSLSPAESASDSSKGVEVNEFSV